MNLPPKPDAPLASPLQYDGHPPCRGSNPPSQTPGHPRLEFDLASIGIYTRIEDAWEENAATQLPLRRAREP